MKGAKQTHNPAHRPTKIYPSEGKRRQAEAGARNLAAWKARMAEAAGKAALTHGIGSYLAGGPLPADVQGELDAFEGGLISDLGGSEEITTAQKALVATSKTALAVVLLTLRWMRDHAVISSRGRPAAVLKILATYINSLRLNLLAMGLHRRAKQAMTLESVLAELESGSSENDTPAEGSADAEPQPD